MSSGLSDFLLTKFDFPGNLKTLPARMGGELGKFAYEPRFSVVTAL